MIDAKAEATTLARRLAALPEAPMRYRVLLEFVERTPAADAAPILDFVRKRGSTGGPPFDVALMTLAAALSNNVLGYEQVTELYAAAKDSGLEGLCTLFFTSATCSLPAYNADVERPLTLGHRKTLARTGSREQISRLLADPEGPVVQELLKNPRIVEADIVRLAARRPADPAVQRTVFANQRWATRAAVRRALVLNPYTPSEISLRLIGLLRGPELRLVATSPILAEAVRTAARRMQRERLGKDPDADDPDAD